MNDRSIDSRLRRDGGRHHSPRPTEVRLSEETVEALARRISELVNVDPPEPPVRRLITAAEVARWCGVDRSWVYAHADELGAIRLGDGERPRLRFDSSQVGDRIDALGVPAHPPGLRSPRIVRDPRRDSLSCRRRASVVEQARAAGRRTNAPGPAPEK